MEESQVDLILIPAPDEPIPDNLDELQKEFKTYDLRQFSFKRIVIGHKVGAAIGSILFPGLGAAIGSHLLQLAATVGPVLGTALGAWLQSRVGRKVRIKVSPDGFEAEAQTPEKLEQLLKRIEEFQQRTQSKNDKVS
ncbi:MAG: hypothetical protein LAO78_27690 [Acidobacteriia bacterium]|nr:hypothetical protein [Terriglobia bacterium]